MQEVFRAKLNDEARLVIPASCRKKLVLLPGQELLVRVNEDESTMKVAWNASSAF
jgi:bifunctional DNA-binding transcriptional regulator/antitoxin component of YhaV-PrlF toxin-antitoxin module